MEKCIVWMAPSISQLTFWLLSSEFSFMKICDMAKYSYPYSKFVLCI